MQPNKKILEKKREKKKKIREKKRGEMGCHVGSKNDEEHGTDFCFFSNIIEVT